MRNPEAGENLFRGKPTHGNNYFRKENPDLTVKIFCTGINFIFPGNPVFRGPAFDDTGNEDPAPFKADRSKKIFQDSAGTPDKRSSREILIFSRGFTDK
jgi:hypothetical protein